MIDASDVIVIGAGQSGLAAAHALRQAGRSPVVLEAGQEPVGSWPSYYDSLTLFSPARYSSLPGKPFPGDPDRYPHRDEVVDYLRRYAKNLDADIRTHHRVTALRRHGERFTVHVEDGTELTAAMVIAASGAFGQPHRPRLPGLDSFTGTVSHSAEYRAPASFAGQRVVVVGAANTAVQVGYELAKVATVTLATRKPITFAPQRPLGRDVHFWSIALGFDHLPIGHLLRNPPHTPVNDDGRYQRAIRARKPDQRRMFTHLDGDTVTWPDGTREHVDTILLATGYRPALSYLDPVERAHSRGISTSHPGLGYVGLEWQRSFASATLRGVGRDAHYVVRRLLDASSCLNLH
ncbi:flavin-containing monooxygenase [Actinophytocola algeriensis]|uniref:Putative flavoprotein involved in K+ transport n=1 Tax=Actinophytocola algeriensis TaxID=1768010 RepID=A0A7W7Q8N3_9PSEU|nr:NAD(P)/FAD-dependent oxidoreductase [Actinophytocola algeriensis]MBB4908689.1 putative flavoprotein involved in K+ transport [Actinophytocola algeriensis]MBE1474924.1 putative flavoprotein involved in K+ transport [Actinophytocola algeriensis]